MSRLFEGEQHAKLYGSFRPTYPSELYEYIITYLSEKSSTRSLALDIGCGSGQGTLPLAKYFNKVIGVDISEAQINQAPRTLENVSFRVGFADDLSFVETGSVDLITVAATLHWLDREKFYTEARRVLRGTGVLAVYGYRLLHPSTENKETENLLSHELYEMTFKKGGYLNHNVQLVSGFFEDSFTLPFKDYQRVKGICIKQSCTIEQMAGLLSTFSGYQQYLKDHPNSTLLEDIVQRLKMIYNDADNSTKIDLSWPMFLLLGRH